MSKPLIGSANDPEQVEAAKREKGWQQKQHDEYVRQVWESDAGQYLMQKYLTACHVFEPIATGDVARLAFCEGERSAGLMIWRDAMRVCPDRVKQVSVSVVSGEDKEKQNG